jgi:CheY-like chemotaxis protein/HPt (histidine-containing phosphotransfer) domain-containing protein
MSHEIRTPINGIIGMADLLELSLSEKELREKLSVMKRSAQALLALLSGVLDLAQMENGSFTITPVEFRLPDLVKDVADLMTPMAQEKGLTVSSSLSTDLPEVVRGDALRIRQVLLNLAGNAVKFTERGGIRLDARLRAATPPRLRVAIAVRDTGIGIPSDRHDAIFEQFTQVDPSTERRFSGTGLGLSISSEIVRLLGGSLSVESELGKGSTFTFELELDQATSGRRAISESAGLRSVPPVRSCTCAKRDAARATDGLPGAEHAPRVLVAEDYEANRIVVEQLLKLLGCSVDSVANGRQAVEAMSRGPYDLVLMDVQMPVMDGLAATAAIRTMEEPLGTHTPILAYTAHSMEEDLQRCLRAGMDDILTKPTQFNDLTTALARWSRPGARVPLPQPPSATVESPDLRRPPAWADRLLERCLGDRRLAREVLRALLDSVGGPISGLNEGLASANPEQLRRSAHSLKGLLLTIGAEDEASACRELEQAARHSDLERARELTGTVQHRWRCLKSTIQVYLQSTG